jgi:hypothetical protein
MRYDFNSRKSAIKLFFVAFVAVIGIDTLPLGISSDSTPFTWIYSLKSTLRPALRPIGLWQSEWRLFAPDPVVNNCWWTIETRMHSPKAIVQNSTTGSQPLGASNSVSWNSPFWGEVKPTEKFFKRRHIAYLRRLSEFPVSVLEDFADEWVRERFGNRLQPLGNIPLEMSMTDNSVNDRSLEREPFVLELNLYRNELKLAPHDAGKLPARDETMWLSVTEKYLQRRYAE